MRLIKYQKSDLESKVLAKLKAKHDALCRKKKSSTRKTFMRTNSDWRLLTEALSKLSEYKCWFTEVYEIGAYFNVDHLRPKNGIVLKSGLKMQNGVIPQSLKDDGYWWECYNWQNYRLLATRSNSGYKGNYYPIRDTSAFWADRTIANAEVSLLLDPLNKKDCDLLHFDLDGKVYPNPSKAASGSFEEAKVEATIVVYGLNDDAFVRARKKEWQFTDKIAVLADEINNKLIAGGLAADVEQLFKKVKNVLVDTLKTRVAKSAEFSRLNHSCLVATGKKWIRTEVLGLK